MSFLMFGNVLSDTIVVVKLVIAFRCLLPFLIFHYFGHLTKPPSIIADVEQSH